METPAGQLDLLHVNKVFTSESYSRRIVILTESNVKSINITWLSLTDLTNLNSGEGGSNYIDVKKFASNGKQYPYVSGQAMRAYIKECMRRSLSEKEYMCVPDSDGHTCGDIKRCILCDMFGFMIPKKKVSKSKGQKLEKGAKETKGGALTRISPVKVSPAVGLLPFVTHSTLDFLTVRKPQEKEEERAGGIVNVELGTNLYKCGIAIDLVRVGAREVIDFKNRQIKIQSDVPEGECKNRIRKVLGSLKFLADYSKQARLMTDFTPDVICATFQRVYSHRLQKLFDLSEENRKINSNRLNEILTDVKKYSDSVYFGLISNVVNNEGEIVNTLKELGIQIQKPDEVFESILNHKSLV